MSTNETPLVESKEGRDFEKLVVWASALSMAVMAAFLASLKQVNPDLQIRFSAATVIAFFVGGALTLLFVHFVRRADKKKRAPIVIGTGLASMVVYIAVGIKDTAQQSRSDVMIGMFFALVVLSCIATVLWRVARFMESEANAQKPASDQWQ